MHLRRLAALSTFGCLLAWAPVSRASEPHVLRDLAIPSPTLGQPIPCAVTLPDDYDRDPTRRFPVLLLLHGTDGTENDWLDAGGLVDGSAGSVAEGGLPFIIVTPGAGNSWYVDNGSVAWETALVDDLLPAIDARFRTIPGRAGRAIAGLSMGGYGAVHLALRHPDQFAAVASLSGALLRSGRPLDRRRHRRLPRRLRRAVRSRTSSRAKASTPTFPSCRRTRRRHASTSPAAAATSTASTSPRCGSTRHSSSTISRRR